MLKSALASIALAAATLAAGTANAYTVIGTAPVGSTILDFEAFTVGTNVASIGLASFTTINGTGAPTIDTNEIGSGKGLNGGPADPSIYTSIAQDAPVRVTFAGGASSAGGEYIDGSPFIGRGLFYDVNGVLIATFVLDAAIDFWGLAVDTGDALIGSIVFDSSGGYPGSGFAATVSESYTIDNVFFKSGDGPPNGTPEPGTMALLGLAAMGLVASRRRKA